MIANKELFYVVNHLVGSTLILVFHKALFLVPYFFLIYINDLPENLVSVAKLFADDTSIFSTVYDKTKTSMDLNQDLSTIEKMGLSMENVF